MTTEPTSTRLPPPLRSSRGPCRGGAHGISESSRAACLLLSAVPRLALFTVLFFAGCLVVSTRAAQTYVTNVSDIAIASSSAQPGDVLIMADGVWRDADVVFRALGTAENPITLRAQTPGQVHLSGHSRLRIAGSHLVVEGLLFTNGYRTNSDVVSFRFNSATVADNCRLTDCAIIDYNPPDSTIDNKWISMYGVSNRVDNCFLKGKNNSGSTVVVWVDSSAPNYHRIDHNHFGPRPALAVNGGETIRVGSAEVSLSSSRSLIEHNYFELCNGDIEVVSNKSCDNTYRYNTFFECEGSLTLRHGNRCVVEGNYFFGNQKPRTGGIRIIGEDHKVFNNYCVDLTGSAWGAGLSISKGLTNTPLNGYAQAKRALVAFNTFVNCSNSILVGLASTQSGTTNVTTLPPEDCIIVNNIVRGRTPTDNGIGDPEDHIGEPDYVPGKNLLEIRGETVNFLWGSNIVHGAIPGTFDTNVGIWEIEPKMVAGADRLWRLAADSPARGVADATAAAVDPAFSQITTDFDGQARQSPTDIGADQFSIEPVVRGPSSPVTVGPVWLRPSATVVNWANPADIVYGTPLGSAQLNARANVPGTFVYDPPAGAILNAGDAQVLSVQFTPDDLLQYSVVTQSVRIDVNKANPQVTWSSPPNMTYGTPLGAAQLNAVANVPGLFVYNPPAGTIFNAGFGRPVTGTFTPFDTTNYNSVVRNVAVNVLPATPVITWFSPASITNGTPLGPEQLSATANTPGTFVYTPPAGTILNAGNGQTLFVSFTPFDGSNYTTASRSVTINVTSVGRTVPTLTWETPADIVEGAALGSAQLNATADVPGSFVYTPPEGTVLPVGSGHVLSVTFTPDDTNAYATVSRTVTIDVVKPVSIVRVAYIVPSNRSPQTNAVPDLASAIRLYQTWFRDQMERNGFGPKTFTVETDGDRVSPKVHVVQVPETDAHLRGDIWGGRVVDAVRNAGLPLGTAGQIWWLVPETHLQEADGSIRGGFDIAYSYGGSGDDAGWAMSGSDFLGRCHPDFLTNGTPYDGLVVRGIGPYPLRFDISYPWFEGTTLSAISSAAIGAGLRSLGEALGLEHDFRNDQNFNGNVMGFGFRGIRGFIYPQLYPFNDTRLSYGLALVLNVSPYFNPERTTTDSVLPTVTIQTSGTNTPVNGTLRIRFSASDNRGLAAAVLCWLKDSDRVIIDELALNGASVSEEFVTPYYDQGKTNQYFVSVFDLQGNKRMVSTGIVPRVTLNHAPLPSIRANPINVGPGEDVVLDAAGTFDAEHGRNLLESEWDLDGDGFFDTEPANSLFYTNRYGRLGSYLVRARLTDPAGASAVSAPISVNVVPCATTLSPMSRNHGFGLVTNSVTVETGAKCIWSAETGTDWITFIDGSNRTGSGSLFYVVHANPSLSPRTGTFTVGDKTFTIFQSGVICTFTLSPGSRTHGFGATTNTVRVTTRAECEWQIVNTNAWITIHSGTEHVGSGTILYSITNNRAPTERIGTFVLGDQPFTITQWGTNCTYLLSRLEALHSAAMGTGIVNLAANTTCSWFVINTNNWITLLSSPSGSGSSNIIYRVDANLGPAERTGAIVAAGQAITIRQQPCSFALAETQATLHYDGGRASVRVTASGDCPWTVTSTAPWISIETPPPYVGDRVIHYSVAANDRNLVRQGQLQMAGRVFEILQSPLPCSYNLVSVPSWEHGEAPEAGEVEVVAGRDCLWEVVNTNSWISIIAGNGGVGSGSVVYLLERNFGAARQGVILVAGSPVLIRQGRGIRTGFLGEMTVASGQTNCLPIVLETFGNECMLDLSVCYDPRILTFAGAWPTTYVPNGRVEVTTNDIGAGRVGLALRMPEGWSLRPGQQAVVEVCFRGGNVTGNVSTVVAVCDQPVARQLLGVLNIPLNVEYGHGAATVKGFCTFGESIDAPQYNWAMKNGAWFCQTNVTSDGLDAAESPFVPDGTSTSFSVNVVGPGTLSFWWKVSSEPSNDRLRFYIDGTEQFRISGEVDWERREIAIPSGTVTLEWQYSKNSGGIIGGADRGWVDQIKVTGAAPTITTQPNSQSVDAGANITFSVTANGTAPLSYEWQRNGVPLSDGGNITGSSSSSLRLTSVQVSDAGIYSVVIRNPLGETISSDALLTVSPVVPLAEALDTPTMNWTTTGNTPPWNGQILVSQDGEDAAHSGGAVGSSTVTMYTSVTGPGTITFWWRVSSLTNSHTLRFNIATSASSSGTEMARISGEVDWQQRSFDVPSGTRFLKWSYQKNSSAPAGLDRGWVDRVHYGPMPPVISSQPVSQEADEGGTVTFNTVAAGSQPLSYQWQFMGVDLADGNGVRGATTPSLTVSNLSLAHSGSYVVRVTNPAGTVLSSNAVLQVQPVVPLAEALDTTNLVWTTTGSPRWAGQPLVSRDGVDAARSGDIPDDQVTTLQTTVAGPGTIGFWWKVSSQSSDELMFFIGSSERAAISGEVDWQWRTFAVSSGNQTLQWRYDKNGSGRAGQDRGWVDGVIYVPNNVPTAPTIVIQPTNRLVTPGSNFTFSITAFGSTPMTYTWRFNGENLTNGAGISGGTTTATLSFTNVQAVRSGLYACLVSNAAGVTVSEAAELRVITAPEILVQPLEREVRAGGTTNFTVLALGAPTLRYQWQLNGTNLPSGGKWSGTTSSNLVIANVAEAQAGPYTVVITNSFGSAISSPALMTVLTPPSIVQPPLSQAVKAGTNLTLRVTAAGNEPLGYQWQFNGAPLLNGPGVAGAQSPALVLNNVQAGHAGAYSVVVTNPVGSATSASAALTVISPPTITSPPLAQSVDEGANVSFNVIAAGTPPLSYRWLYNGVALADGGSISGATTPGLSLTSAQSAHAGNYSVVVSNAAGLVASSPVQLTVRAALTLGEAVDAEHLTWTTGLAAPWLAQTNLSHDGIDAARSSTSSSEGVAWLETVVEGPGTLRFWWKVASEAGNDRLVFTVSGAEFAAVSGELDWQWEIFSIPPGSQTLRWTSSHPHAGGRRGSFYVDEVHFTRTFGPSPPVIARQPLSRDVEPGVNVTFSVAASGSAPLSYQWRFNGVDLLDGDFVAGATTPILTLFNVQDVNNGSYNVVVRNEYSWDMSAEAVLRVIPSIPLPEALDKHDVIWVTGGSSPWVGQAQTTYDWLDAAQSGALGHGQSNHIETLVVGPGAVSFWWRTSSETNADRLRFFVNNVERANISGDSDWRWRTFDVGPGNQVLRWAYTKNASNSVALDRAWVDYVQFGPSSPTITNQPDEEEIVDIGGSVKINVDATGTPPLTYQWRFNGTNLIEGGNIYRTTKDSLLISNAMPWQAGKYSVLVSNPGGRVLSEECLVTVIPRYPLDEALNTPGWQWRTYGFAWWIGDTDQAHDGVLCARNGIMPNSEETWMETTLVGPGTLKFWWKVSSESNRDWLRFFVNSNELASISGNVDWNQRAFELPIGTNIVKWRYSKDSINTGGVDRAWVDEVSFGYTGPSFTTQPVGRTIDQGGSASFSVSVIGTPPFSYQWQHNGVGIPNATNATLSLNNVQLNQAGNYSVVVRNVAATIFSSNAVLTVNPVIPIADAVDRPGSTWTVSGSPPWVGQLAVNHDGVDAARSGATAGSGTTYIETVIPGPGVLSWWWRVSSLTNAHYLRFRLNGSDVVSISGESGWLSRTQNLAAGNNTLRWSYIKNSSAPAGQDRAWLDQLVFVPNPPTITAQPTNRVVDAGTTVSLSVTAGGTPPYNYQWRFNGVSLNDGPGIRGARTDVLTLTNVVPAQSGNYSVVVSNPSGSATSANAFLSVNPIYSLAEALDTSGLVWATSGSPPWYGQGVTTRDGVDAAASGMGGSSEKSVQTTVVGPGTLTFWWKVSSYTNNNYMEFFIGSSRQARISGEVDWQQRTFNISGSGNQTLRWVYDKNSSTVRGQDRAWLDQVVYTPSTSAAPPPTEPITAEILLSNGAVLLSWRAVPDKSYAVFYKDDFAEPDWKVLNAEIHFEGNAAFAYDLIDAGWTPQRFYIISEY